MLPFSPSAPDFRKQAHPSGRSAFSLIEVVLAIGVVAIALVGIFGLFSASLKNNRDTSAQQEGFEVVRLIHTRMQDTNFISTNALQSLMSALYVSKVSSNYFAFVSNGSSLTITNNASVFGNSLTNGTLYLLQLTNVLTTNVGVAGLATNIFPVAILPNARLTDWTNWPGLPVRVRVYPIARPAVANSITNAPPTMTFDMVIPR